MELRTSNQEFVRRLERKKAYQKCMSSMVSQSPSLQVSIFHFNSLSCFIENFKKNPKTNDGNEIKWVMDVLGPFLLQPRNLFKHELGRPRPQDEGRQRGKQFQAHHRPWPSPRTILGQLYLDTLLFFLPSTGIETWGCRWGLMPHSFMVKFGVKWSKTLQNIEKNHT